jgi:hypothetical protein
MVEPAQMPPFLLPRVKRLVPLMGRAQIEPLRRRLIEPGEITDAGRNPEAYRLRLDASGATLEGHTDAAIRHGLATLAQIERQYGSRPPGCLIEDWPAFPTRGLMLDISRDRVPTNGHLGDIVDHLASLKLNHFQLYTEHTFAYDGHSQIWADASPMTPEEVRGLDRYCRVRGIELAANQNCFGHLASWLRHPRYAHLAETHGEWTFENAGRSFKRSGPFSLCPLDPGSIDLVRDLLSQLLPCFHSPLVNIGCDETFDIGAGRSKDEVARRSRPAVYFDFVRQVVAAAAYYDRRCMMWADIALSHPESIHLIPEGVIGLAWGYEPDAAFGEWVSRLRDVGRPPPRRRARSLGLPGHQRLAFDHRAHDRATRQPPPRRTRGCGCRRHRIPRDRMGGYGPPPAMADLVARDRRGRGRGMDGRPRRLQPPSHVPALL